MKKTRKNKSGKGILVLVLLLAIGFASVSTTLVITGVIKLGFNQDNFDNNVIFTTPTTLTYSDPTGKTVVEPTIENNGKSINFTVGNLSTIGESATLNYTISNNSQYEADLTGITCRVYNGSTAADATEANEVTNAVVTAKTGEHIKLESALELDPNIPVRGTREGSLTMTMIKSYVGTETSDTKSYYVTCDIVADPVGANAPTEATPAE